MTHYVIFTKFFKVTWPKNVPAYVKTEGTWQKRNYIRNVLQPTRSLCHFRFKSYGHYLIFTKVVTLTLPFVRLSKKKVLHCRVSRRHLLQKKIRTIGQAVRPVEPLKTDRQTQTDTQTDRGDQYTLRKVFRKVIRGAIIGYFSYYIDFNWPWPLTLTFDLDLDLHLYCKKKRNVVTSREAKRRLAYKNGNYLPIGISSRINLQPTRSLYHFRFKSYGPLCDFHWFLFKVTLKTWSQNGWWQNRRSKGTCLYHFRFKSYTSKFFKTWRAGYKTEGTWQKRNYIRNVLQPTRSLCHFRFKSYGHYLIFTKVVTLTLPFVRLSKKKVLHCRVSRRHLLQKKSGRSDKRCGL